MRSPTGGTHSPFFLTVLSLPIGTAALSLLAGTSLSLPSYAQPNLPREQPLPNMVYHIKHLQTFFLHLERERRQQSNLNVVTIYILVNLGMINYLGGGGASGFNDRTRLPRSSLMEFSRVKHTVAHITT